MYCKECGQFLDKPICTPVYEIHTEVDTGMYEKKYEYSCPHCGSADIEESETCVMCGEETKGRTLCENCREELEAMIDFVAEKHDVDREKVLDGLCEYINEEE